MKKRDCPKEDYSYYRGKEKKIKKPLAKKKKPRKVRRKDTDKSDNI